MQNGDRTPTLYSFYDDQYDFNDLSRRVDTGLNDYISTLKKGKKYESQIREAVSNLMSGVKDGTITFSNGRYNDSLGRYRNDKDRDKDVYGWAANYIYSNMGKSEKYVAPEDKTKIKWGGNSSIGQALIRDIFNSDSGNIQDFIDLDPYDEDSQSRGTTQRAARLSNAFQNVLNNFDSIFTNYTDADKRNATQWINQAIQSLNTNGFGDDDYLSLSRAAGGVNFRDMFSSQQKQVQQSQQQQGTSPQQSGFVSWMQQHYPQFTGTLHTPLLLKTNQTFGKYTLDRLRQAVSNLSENDLYRIVRQSITDQNYTFNNEQFIKNSFQNSPGFSNPFGLLEILQSMKNRGLLQSFGENNLNLYYIPKTDTDRQTAWVWDTTDNSVKEMSFHNIPYWRQRIQQEYSQQTGSQSTPFEQFLRESGYQFKNGGIIKAQTGVKFSDNANWYTGVFTPQLNHIIQGLKQDSNYYTWLNNMQDRHSEIYKSAGDNWQNTAYRNDLVGSYQDLYKSGYNNEWGDNTVGYNSLGIQNAQNLGMFDVSGRRRTSGDWNGNGNSWNTDSLYSAITDYRRLLGREGDYTPEQLAYATEQFKNAGYNFIKDANGYYKLEPIIQQDPLEEVAQSPKIENNADESQVAPVPGEVSNPNNRKGQFADVMMGLIPDAIGVGRLFASLRTNNRVANTLRESLNPVLRNTYERYSPITGAFSEMQFRNRQAANLRRQASRPFTSDASLQLAGQLDADRQARDLEYQGFLADDREIRRTREAALARQEDNMARRSDVANFNRASINQTNRERAQLEATRLRRNWQSIDNFLAGMEGRLRTRFESDRERRNNFRLWTGISDIETRYQDAIQGATDDVRNWQAKNPGMSISSMPNYNNYINFIREMNRWKAAQAYKTHADVYGYSYNNDILSKTPESIRAIYGYRKGGSLKPSTMNLINKVIKNESYT